MIVVLDTNVWISALHFDNPRSVPSRALDRATEHDVIAISDDLEEEIFRILVEKFRWPAGRVRAALDLALKKAVRFKAGDRIRVCRDPNDDMFLECAAVAGADLIVSGDKDLLSLGSYGRTRIVTPMEYVGMTL